MKIGIVGQATFEEMPGGSARHLSGLTTELRRSGHDVHVLTSTPYLPTDGPLGRGPLGRMLRTMARVAVVIPLGMLFVLRHRPDVINIHFPLDGLGALAGAVLTGRPVVVTFHGPWALEAIAAGDAPRGRLITALRRGIEGLVYERAAACIVMSQAFGELLVREYGVNPQRVTVVPLGIDTARFPVIDRQTARARLNLPDRPTVVTVRRLVPRVGLDLAIRALARLPDESRPRLVVAGSGPEREGLERLATSEGIGPDVTFLGFVPDERLADVYAAGDVCVMPSRELEGFGYGALEALAAGTPVVAVGTDGLVDLVGGIEPRWLVPFDPDALAATLDRVARLPDEYPSREECRAYAEHFSWPTVAAATLAVYEAAT